MWIWPSDRVVLDSAYSSSVLLERIASQTDPQPILDSRPNDTGKPYEGWVERDSFRIRPAWSGRRHSFRVFIEGRVDPHGPGSRLLATVHLDRGTLLFFLVIALVVACAALLRPVVVGVAWPSWVFWLLYFVTAGFAYSALMVAYWAGMGGARSFLEAVAAGPERSTASDPFGAQEH